ncbi:hypothetical protein DOK_12056 [gamma proteobacterium BDW918]|nr:hypothetical protein DOK_12056 [gamma proteobacterium BDW918]
MARTSTPFKSLGLLQPGLLCISGSVFELTTHFYIPPLATVLPGIDLTFVQLPSECRGEDRLPSQTWETWDYLVALVSAVASDQRPIKLLIEGLWPGFKGERDFITDVPRVGNIKADPGSLMWDESSHWGVCDF